MELYANIGIGHENDLDLLKSRVITAAQCNADAVVINKSTPTLTIPEEKKYVPIPSKWGTKPYIEVAKLSELSKENAKQLSDFCNEIGIPVVWSVTDLEALSFVEDVCNAKTIKAHYDAVEPVEIIQHCFQRQYFIWASHKHIETTVKYYKTLKHLYGFYYTTEQFPPELEQMNLHHLDDVAKKGYTVAYEGREAGIYPAIAVGYKPVHHIEKYLGEDNSDHSSILTPAQFYDMFNSLEILTKANRSIVDQLTD
jgi:sialic acid synthase SpsE